MKKWILIVTLLVAGKCSYAQSLYIDIQRDWFGNIRTVDWDMQDTIVLYPNRPADIKDQFTMLWQYQFDYVFQPTELYHPTPGYDQQYYSEKWEIIQKEDKSYELTVKYNRTTNFSHKRQRRYKLIPYRDNYNILQKLVLARLY